MTQEQQVEEIAEAFLKICDLAKHDKVAPMAKLPGLWERKIDKQWEIAVNGQKQAIEWPQTHERMGCNIPPMHCAVMYNGWLAGLFSPYGGVIAAHPSKDGANEENFIAAIEKAIAL